MPETKQPTGLALALELLAEHTCEWAGGDSAETIAAARFAVVIERDDESWIFSADDWEQVAGYALTCLTGTEGYDEWIEGVYDVATGEKLEVHLRTSVTLTTPDGKTYVADDTGVQAT